MSKRAFLSLHIPLKYQPSLRVTLVLLVYLILFILLDRFSLALQTAPGVVAWYPSDGLSFALLLVFGSRFLPAIGLASLISSFFIFQFSFPPVTLLGWAVLLSLTYGLAARLLQRLRINHQLRHTRDLVWLIFATAVVSTILAAVSVSASVANGTIPESDRFSAMARWWVGEMTGVLTFTPFLLIHIMPWVHRFAEKGLRIRRTVFQRPSLKVIGQVLTLFITVYLILYVDWPVDFQPLFLVVVPLAWIAFQFGSSGVSLAIAVVNLGITLVFWSSRQIDTVQFSQLQLQLLIISVASLLNGSIIAEYKQSHTVSDQTATGEMKQRQEKINRELLIIFVSALAVWVLEYIFDLHESVTEWEREIGLKGLDETLVMAMFLGFAFAFFSYRRWKEVREEIQERHKAEAELNRLNHQLEQRVRERTADLSKANQSLQAEITERQQAEEALKKSEKRFRGLIENNADAITLLDANGVVVYNSPSAPGMLGYGPEEGINRSVFELLHPDDLPNTLLKFRSVADTPDARLDATFRLRHNNGTWLWIEAVATNLLAEPSVMAVVVNYRDITKRKRAEQALLVSEDRYRDLVENSHDLIFTHDLEGRLLSINPHAEQVLEYSSGSLLNTNIRDLLSPRVRKDFGAYLSRLKERGVAEGTLIVQTLSGEERIWEYRNTLRTEGVKNPVVRGMARDVTEQKQAEQEVLNLARFPAENPSPVMRFAPDCSVLFTNNAGKSLLEYWARGGKQTIPDELKERIYEAYDSGTNTEIEIGFDERTFSCILAPIQEAGYLNFYGRDITDRTQVEVELRESEKRFRDLFQNTPISIWEEDFSEVKNYLDSLKNEYVTDPGTYFANHPEVIQKCAGLVKVLDVNQASLELFGAENKANLFGNLERTFTPESYMAFQQELIAITRGVTKLTMDARVKTLAGLQRIVTMIWAVLPGHENCYSKVLVSLSDITERKQAEEEVSNRTNELLTLYGLSRALAGADDLDEILTLVNRNAAESIHITFSRIALLEGDQLVTRAVYPIRVLENDFLIGEHESLAALPYVRHVLEQAEPVILHKGNSEVNSSERSFLLLDSTQTLCLTPLRIGRPAPNSKHIMGLMMLGEVRNEEREPFTQSKVRLAQSIADQAAVAIRRMLLHEQTERRLQQLAALRDIDQAIASSFDLQLSAGVLLLHMTEQLGIDAAAIWVVNPGSRMLEFKAGRGFRSKVYERAKPIGLGEGYVGRAALERRMIHISDLMAQQDNPRLMRALEIEMFASYYGVPLLAKGSVKGVLEVFHRTQLDPDEEWLDFLNALAGQAAIAIDNVMLFENLQHSNDDLFMAYDRTLEGWSAALDLRDKETEGHTQRVTETTVRLAKEMGFSEQDMINVRRGSLLHDIGKMGIPDRILLKPGKLTEEEWEIMRKHPGYAYNLISPIAYLRPALDIPYCHHEKWDGTGYPRGLKGEDIPLAARLFAIVDVWDALGSDRPYRDAWSQENVLAYLQEQSGSHFDPEVVGAFMSMMNRDINKD